MENAAAKSIAEQIKMLEIKQSNADSGIERTGDTTPRLDY